MNNRNTPYFEYDEKPVKSVLKNFDQLIHQGVEIYYAMKANAHPKLLKLVLNRGMGLDVASVPEIKFALEQGASANKMVYAATSKKKEDIEYAKQVGINVLMADSLHVVREIDRVYRGTSHIIVLRMQGHGSHATYNLSDKFGLTITEAQKILKKASQRGYQVKGFTFHVGSQNIDFDAWDGALEKLLAVADDFRKFDLNLEFIDLGGGIPARYDNDKVLKSEVYIKELLRVAKKLQSMFPGVRIAIEPGRVIAAPALNLYTSVVDIKRYKSPPVVIVDTSVFIGLIEAVYGVTYPLSLVRVSKSETRPFTIAGITCDGCDVIYPNVELPKDLKVGDLLKISLAGAYTTSWEKVHLLSWPEIV